MKKITYTLAALIIFLLLLPFAMGLVAKQWMIPSLASTQSLKYGYHAELIAYQMGWFKSTARVRLVSDGWLSKGVMSSLQPRQDRHAPHAVTFDVAIAHGPIFYDRTAKKSLSFGIVQAKTQLDSASVSGVVSASASATGLPKIEFKALMSWLGRTDIEVQTVGGFNSEEPSETIRWGGFTINAITRDHAKYIDTAILVAPLKIRGQKERVSLSAVEADSSLDYHFSSYMPTGWFELRLDKAELRGIPGVPATEVVGLFGRTQIEKQGGRINLDYELAMDAFSYDSQRFKQPNVKLRLSSLDANAMAEYYRLVDESLNAELNAAPAESAAREEQMMLMLNNAEKLIGATQTMFSGANLTLSASSNTPEGFVSIDLNLDMPKRISRLALDQLKDFTGTMDVRIAKPALEKLIAFDSAKARGPQSEVEPTETPLQEAKRVIAQQVKAGLITETLDQYSTHLKLQDGKILANGIEAMDILALMKTLM